MAIRKNADGSVTVGILDDVKDEKKSAPVQEQTEKKPAKRKTASK